MLVPSVLFNTKETVVCDTPAARAMSLLVMRRVIRAKYSLEFGVRKWGELTHTEVTEVTEVFKDFK